MSATIDSLHLHLTLILLSTLSKRQTTLRAIVLIVRLYINFVPRCTIACQTTHSPGLRTSLYQVTIETFIFLNVPMYRNGVYWQTAPRVQLVAIQYITVIGKISAWQEERISD